jgi:hypothetical protein
MTSDVASLARIARTLGVIALAACSSGSSRGNPDASVDAGASDAPQDGAFDAGAGCPPECFRPINCRLSCNGPIVSSGCCPCMPPAFDDICCANNTCPL